MREATIPDRVQAMADRLVELPGVVAVVLGGSRATGSHRPDSDFDLGLYVRGTLDVAAVRTLAMASADQVLDVVAPGGWGPWVNGGAWLVVDGVRVDWIYRDLDRVTRIWADCRAGRYEIGIQAGHPLGFYSHVYAGEVALCRPLADPSGELAALRAQTQPYPAALAAALVAATWESDFLLYGPAHHGVHAVDAWYTAGCVFRAIGVLAHALHAHHGRWVRNEKQLIDEASELPGSPAGFARRVRDLLGGIGTTERQIAATVAAARALITDTRAGLPVARP